MQFVIIFILKYFLIDKSTAVEQVVACALVTQRARVRFPVGKSFLGEVFSGFFLTCKSNVRELQAHKVPEYHLAIIIIIIISLRAPTTLDVDAPLNPNIQIPYKQCFLYTVYAITMLDMFSFTEENLDDIQIARCYFIIVVICVFSKSIRREISEKMSQPQRLHSKNPPPLTPIYSIKEYLQQCLLTHKISLKCIINLIRLRPWEILKPDEIFLPILTYNQI